MRLPMNNVDARLSPTELGLRLQDALGRLFSDISEVSAAANESCQVVRTSERDDDGNYTVQIAVLPIGASGLQPKDYVVILERQGGGMPLVGYFEAHNTARFRSVEEGEYRATVSIRVLTTASPREIVVNGWRSSNQRFAAATSLPGVEENLRLKPSSAGRLSQEQSEHDVSAAAPSEMLMKSMSDDDAFDNGERPADAQDVADLRVTIRPDEKKNQLVIRLTTRSTELVGVRLFVRLREGDREIAFMMPEIIADKWHPGEHGAMHVVENVRGESQLTVTLDPFVGVSDAIDEHT